MFCKFKIICMGYLQTRHHTRSVSPEKNKYVTASTVNSTNDVSEASTLEMGGLEGYSQPPHWVQGTALVGVQGAKPLEISCF